MHRNYLLSVVFAALALFAGASLAATVQGTIQELSGTVQVSVAKGKPVSAVKGQSLGNNTTITTGPKSSVIMLFLDGTVIALEQNTSFEIQDYNYDAKQPSAMKALFGLASGAMRAVTGLIGQKNRDSMRVATPNATIGIRGTDFMVAYAATAGGTTSTGVVAGTITVNSVAGTFTVTIGGASVTVAATATQLASLSTLIASGTFGQLATLQLGALASTAASAAASGAGAGAGAAAAAAAAGVITPAAVAGAAAAAAAAAAVVGGTENPPGTSGTTGTTGTTGTQ